MIPITFPRSLRAPVVDFAVSFARSFWSAFVWSIKLALAATCVVAGIAAMFACLYMVVQPDPRLASDAMHTFGRGSQPLGHDNALRMYRFMLLYFSCVPAGFAWYCFGFIRNWWNTVVRHKRSRAELEDELELINTQFDRLSTENQCLVDSYNDANSLNRDLALVFKHEELRLGVLQAVHPSNGVNETEQARLQPVYEAAARLFERIEAN